MFNKIVHIYYWGYEAWQWSKIKIIFKKRLMNVSPGLLQKLQLCPSEKRALLESSLAQDLTETTSKYSKSRPSGCKISLKKNGLKRSKSPKQTCYFQWLMGPKRRINPWKFQVCVAWAKVSPKKFTKTSHFMSAWSELKNTCTRCPKFKSDSTFVGSCETSQI